MRPVHSAATLAALVTSGILAVTAASGPTSAVTARAGSGAQAGSDGQVAPRGNTTAYADCTHREIEPTVVLAGCSDRLRSLRVDTYRSWRADGASGRGRFVGNDCIPNCRRGHLHSFPATFRFTGVVHTADGAFFTKVVTHHVEEQEDQRIVLRLRPAPGRS